MITRVTPVQAQSLICLVAELMELNIRLREIGVIFNTGERQGSCAKFSPDFLYQLHSFLPAESETNPSAPQVLSLSFSPMKEEGYLVKRGKLANKTML